MEMSGYLDRQASAMNRALHRGRVSLIAPPRATNFGTTWY